MPPNDGGRDVDRAESTGTSHPVPAAADPAFAQYRTAILDATRLNRLFAILTEQAPPLAILDRVLVALCEMFAADIGALLQPDPRGGLRVVGAIGFPEEPPVLRFSAARGTYAERSTRAHAPILVERALEDSAMDPQLVDLGVETAAWIPVLGSRGVVAVLVLSRCQVLPFAPSDADMLMAMAYRIGLMLERAAADEERARLEARLRQAEKAESLARMAAAVAHHFNNKLTAVTGHIELALDDLGRGTDPTQEMIHAREATRQAATVGELMLAYLGVSLHPRRDLDLVSVADTVLADLRRTIPPHVGLQVELPDRPIVVRASSMDIRRILSNLIDNAVESMADREGEVRVSVREVDPADVDPSTLVSAGWTPADGLYACIEVVDGGTGMDAGVLKNAFDPFFTTKFTGRGLGLPVVLGLVRASDGAVAIESARGRGTTARVYLPFGLRSAASASRSTGGQSAGELR